MKKYRYGEGTWFAVPLAKGGYAVGIIIRGSPKTTLVCSFFGPRREKMPKLQDIEGFTSNQATSVWHTADLEIRRGNWPILGTSESFSREDWPMPVFVHKGLDLELDGEKFPGRVELRYYDDDDPTLHVRKKIVKGKAAREALESLPRDGLLGSGAVESVLDDML